MNKKKTVSLDFDGRVVRMLVTKRNKILQWDSASLAPEMMDEGLIQDPKSVGEGLAQFLEKRKVSKRRVVTSVSGNRSVSRVLTLPKIKDNQLEEAVQRKAKQEMPLPMDETYLSWQVLKSENEHLEVYALAVPKPIIDQQLETLKFAGIKPRLMEFKSLALVRMINRADAIIVNLEHQSLGVIIVLSGIPEIIRSVPLSMEEGESANRIERLALELNRTTQFYDDGHRERPLPPNLPLYATGALFENGLMLEQFARATPFPVSLPEPPYQLPVDFPLARFSVNLGLAMKGG